MATSSAWGQSVAKEMSVRTFVVVWGTTPLALNGGSGADAVMILSVSQCTLRANQIQAL